MRKLSAWLMIVAFAGVPILASADAGTLACCQGQIYGHTLGDWQRLYWEWALGASDQQGEGRVFFMPIPEGTPNDGAGTPEDPVIYIGKLSIRLRAGRPFMLPVSAWIGESYTRRSLTPDDDPATPPKAFFTGQQVRLSLDGRQIINSSRQRLDRIYSEANFFTAPIDYVPPQNRGGGVFADAALWVKGLGIVLPPLPPGRHVLRLAVDSKVGYGFLNTWHITVIPR